MSRGSIIALSNCLLLQFQLRRLQHCHAVTISHGNASSIDPSRTLVPALFDSVGTRNQQRGRIGGARAQKHSAFSHNRVAFRQLPRLYKRVDSSLSADQITLITLVHYTSGSSEITSAPRSIRARRPHLPLAMPIA